MDRVVRMEKIGAGAFIMISVEDMIADRLGQHASSSAPDRREQAQLLLTFNPDFDRAYLDRRPSTALRTGIREESSGDYGIADFEV